jgi:hypothetical protein
MNQKRMVVAVALVLALSLMIVGAATAGGWNKWQPINHPAVSGTFKYSDDMLLKIKEYAIYDFAVGDFVGYLAPFASFDEFDYVVYDLECGPQGATGRTTFGKGWFEELTGRDLSFVATDKIYTCLYPAGWHDSQ